MDDRYNMTEPCSLVDHKMVFDRAPDTGDMLTTDSVDYSEIGISGLLMPRWAVVTPTPCGMEDNDPARWGICNAAFHFRKDHRWHHFGDAHTLAYTLDQAVRCALESGAEKVFIIREW